MYNKRNINQNNNVTTESIHINTSIDGRVLKIITKSKI